METQQVDYQQVLYLANQLTPSEQVQLILTLRDRLLGFGMWEEIKEMEDIETYLEELRTAESHHPDGSIKRPEEFLKELEEWDE
jgi:hypothetical protein